MIAIVFISVESTRTNNFCVNKAVYNSLFARVLQISKIVIINSDLTIFCIRGVKFTKAFENGTFVSKYLENLLLAARLEVRCDVKHYVQKPKQLENYYLTSLVWKIH